MISQKDILKVETITLGNRIHHRDYCMLKKLATMELARGCWKSLLSLNIGNNIIMEVGVSHLEMRNANNSQR